jgi:hypothetical protein
MYTEELSVVVYHIDIHIVGLNVLLNGLGKENVSLKELQLFCKYKSVSK